MKLSMRRIVLFTNDMARMVSFYRDVLGLSVCKDERGWKEFDANGCVIALHNGTSQVGKRPPKIGFWSEDVAAARQMRRSPPKVGCWQSVFRAARYSFST